MELTITPEQHPSPGVRRIGRSLEDPYLEFCWAPILGPAAVLLLRRISFLWATECPLVIDVDELGRHIGLSGRAVYRETSGSGNEPTLRRLVRYHFARWTDEPNAAVFVEVPQLPARWLDRLPPLALAAHHALSEMALA